MEWSKLIKLIPVYQKNLHSNTTSRTTTYVVGTFQCHHKKNKMKWSSGKIFVEILCRRQGGQIYFCVNVWNQKCRQCAKIITPTLDEGKYRERVYSKLRLMLGLRDPVIPATNMRKTPPHRKDLCCGCIAGKCLA